MLQEKYLESRRLPPEVIHGQNWPHLLSTAIAGSQCSTWELHCVTILLVKIHWFIFSSVMSLLLMISLSQTALTCGNKIKEESDLQGCGWIVAKHLKYGFVQQKPHASVFSFNPHCSDEVMPCVVLHIQSIRLPWLDWVVKGEWQWSELLWLPLSTFVNGRPQRAEGCQRIC